MAGELTDAGENLALDLLNGGTQTITGPLKLALLTAQGTDSAAGTEVSGGSYARQNMAVTAASGGACENSGSLSFTNMPSCTVVGFAIYDSSGTPKRLWEIPRTGGSIVVSAGSTVTIAAGDIDLSIN